jgi:hypothetical protein
MNYTNLPLIFLFSSSIIYAFFMSIMTFTKNNFSFLSDRYVSQINKDKKSNYHSTLLATTIGSYFGALIIFILLFERLATSDEFGHIARFKSEILFLFLLGLFVLLSLTILLAYFSINERMFGTGNNTNLTYNYPFFNTLCYLIVFLVLGSLYVNNVYSLAKQRDLKLSL